MLPKKEYMITTRSDRQTDRLLFKKRSRSRPDQLVDSGIRYMRHLQPEKQKLMLMQVIPYISS